MITLTNCEMVEDVQDSKQSLFAVKHDVPN
jgi:hypothetical protein